MTEHKNFLNSMAILGLLLAIGMASAAFILGLQAKRALTTQQSITVKGLAEKPIKADNADWTIGLNVTELTQAGALKKLAEERQLLTAFLIEQGLERTSIKAELESLNLHYDEVYINDLPRQVQHGFDAYQNLRIVTKDLAKITQASQNILQFKAQNRPVTAQPPNYTVGNLEAVKMSLIADATKNARARAAEFVKQDHLQVGVMKSASQGAFYILPVGNDAGDEAYGGVNDKSTIDKTARVVVTIIYNIE